MSAVMPLRDPPEPRRDSDAGSLMAIINRAASMENFDVDKLEKLLAVKERWDAAEARKAYTSAMAAFKQNPPEIIKDKRVAFQTSKGLTEYNHATLGGMCAAIVKGLSEHGISHRWDVKQSDARIMVTCILTHEQGHSESVSLNSAPDESGGKNSIQAIASAVTYLQRYTLFAATGLAAEDMDDDGQKAGVALITERQAADLQAKATEVGANVTNFLKYLKVERFSDLPASKYNAALQALKDKGAR